MNEENVIGMQKSISISHTIFLVLKRIFDIICAIIGCLLLIPVTVIVKICYILTGDFKPIFYSHDRIGKYGETFKLHKFRSMVYNADEVLDNMLKDPNVLEKYKENMKLENDPRVTKIGYILRKTSIDEMPQFINVLFNDMSIIGNRPYLPRERVDMDNYYYDIIKTKPGITGYWQTSGRNNLSFKKRLELEKYYSEHCSLAMDIKIFIKTFSTVLFGKGAR